jgi:cytochrome c peroxidase
VLLIGTLTAGCGEGGGGASPELPEIPVLQYATVEDPIEPLPTELVIEHPDRVELGRKLFFDPIMSHDGALACSDCHHLATGGTDNLAFSKHRDKAPGVNTPTVLNVGQLYWLHWAGAYSRLEDQLDTPLESPKVLASTWEGLLDRLRDQPSYARGFAEAYETGLTEDNVRDAVASFERTLVTPNAPFDRYLRGDSGALSHREVEGYRLFKSLGCISCHQGMGIGGNMFQRFGVMKDYFDRSGDDAAAELSRFAVTKLEKDRYVFRVASLRNVALTAPYFHDGSAPTLDEAVGVMAEYQLGRDLTPEQTDLVVAFLHTLTGEIPEVSTE